MITKAIGKRIQQCRREKGFTQEELAERVEISPHYLSALERGLYNVKLELLVNILNTLECSADEVFCDVVKQSCEIKASQLSERLKALPLEEQTKIFDVVDTMVKNSSK